jgi:hypothetical protein
MAMELAPALAKYAGVIVYVCARYAALSVVCGAAPDPIRRTTQRLRLSRNGIVLLRRTRENAFRFARVLLNCIGRDNKRS